MRLAFGWLDGQCVAGARVIDLCKLGDGIVTDMTAQIYRAKKGGRTIEKGIAFPTCVSVNECVCHFSPLESDEPVRCPPPL